MTLTERIHECFVIPVIRLNDASKAVKIADALKSGGIDVVEITFRTEAAARAIELIARERPDMLVGAGTVLTGEHLDEAIEAGAKFAVSPGLNPEITESAIKRGLPFFPGVVTPTEIEKGLSLGLNLFKFFPSESFGGVNTITALSAPFGDIKFIATGGVSQKNLRAYVNCGKVLAVGGSWIATEPLIEAENCDEITRLSKEATEILSKEREKR